MEAAVSADRQPIRRAMDGFAALRLVDGYLLLRQRENFRRRDIG